MRLFNFILLCILLPKLIAAQFYFGLQTDFGKSRVQYTEFDWVSYQYQRFDTYYYRGGKPLALYTTKEAHHLLIDIEQLLGFKYKNRIQFIIYNSFSDFKQSNIGYKRHDEYNIGGKTQIVVTKVMLYFNGDYNDLRKQIAAGITEVILNEMMYGGNIVDAFTNAALLTLPNWFIKGLVAYVSDPWNIELENRVKDKIGTERFNNFNHLEKEDAILAGYSIWNYIGNTYGKQSVAELLHMVRISRNIDNAFLFVLGKSVKTINSEWLEYYFQTDITGIYPSSNLLPIHISKQEKITQVEISPKGNKVAFVTNELGKYRIWIYDLRTKKQSKIISIGHKLDRIVDKSIPILAWEPKGKILAFVTEKKGAIQMNYFEISKEKINTFQLQHLQKVLSISYATNGKRLVMSGVMKNQSDIFIFEIVGHKLTNITNDKFLDLDPSFSSNSDYIIFSSNRPSDILYNDETNKQNKTNDLFLYNYKQENNKLIRLTNTPEIHEIQPKPTKKNIYYFLSDKNGIINRFLLKIDSNKTLLDSIIIYERNIKTYPQTNYNRNILTYDIKPKSKHLVDVLYLNGHYAIYHKKIGRKILKTEIQLTETQFFGLKRSVKENKNHKETNNNESLWILNKVDIQNYKFGKFKEINERLKNSLFNDLSEIRKIYKAPKARAYNLEFSTNYVVSQFDNSYITRSYQSFSNTKFPLFLNPDFDAMIKIGTADLFEDYKIIGGVRLSGNLNSNGYMLSFINNKYRFDKSYIFSSQSINLAQDNSLQKIYSYELRSVFNWPFDDVFSTRGSLSFRNDKIVFLAKDINNLKKPNTYNNWITLRNECIFDNTINKGLNLYNGGRYKFFAEYYRLFED